MLQAGKTVVGRVRLFSLLCLFASTSCYGAELLVNAGGGSQPGADQRNRSDGVDLIFWRHERSYRQEILVGVGYTRLRTDTASYEDLTVVSVFPQLNLYAPESHGYLPFFFVRALGPSWMSGRRYGEREQGKHFAFQAQVGLGVKFGSDREWIAKLSYKHFSNARLFKPNDGFDIPVLLTLGKQW